jgi:hypothetical protein
MNLPNYPYANVYPQARMLEPANVDIGAFRGHNGSHMNRQSRFDARSRRRYGDWSVLGVPTVLLWIDDDADPDPENECGC